MNHLLPTIDTYDLFDLLGLSSLKKEKKATILAELNEYITKRFLISQLSHIKESDAQKLQSLIKNNTDISIIIAYFQKNIPYFYDSLMIFVRKQKYDFLLEYLDKMINDLQQTAHSLQQHSNKIILSKKIEFYEHARNLAKEYNWRELIEHMKKDDK